jgi:hypothetical protein
VPRTPIIEREPEPELSQEEISKWQSKIRAAWQKAVSSIVDVATLLKKTRKEVPHGQWGRLFEGPHAPFSSRTALMLMDIAEHALLSNPKHASDLPCSWYCLFLLSRLPAERLEWLIMDKTVNPALTRNEVEQILRREKSRERRASTVLPRSDLPYPQQINSDFDFNILQPESRKQTPPLSDTLRSMTRLLVDVRDAQDEVRRDAYYRRQFQRIADCILGVVLGEPVVDEMLLLASPDKIADQKVAGGIHA